MFIMIKAADTLIKYLDSQGLLVAASEVYSLISIASNEDFDRRIAEAGRRNPKPFNDWFEGKERVVLDLGLGEDLPGEDLSSTKEMKLREEFPDILEWIKVYFKEDPNEASLLKGRLGSGRKIGEKFFRNILRLKLRILAGAWGEELNISSTQFSSLFQELFGLERVSLKVGNILDNPPPRFGIKEDVFLGNEFEKITLIREISKIAEEVSFWNKEYLASPLRTSKGVSEFKVVISQNPRDIALMSTGRRWTSCVELGIGVHYESIFCELESGGFVAYLVKANDLEIKNPMARIWIRRFTNNSGESIAIPESESYGEEQPGFVETVKAWISSKQGDLEYGTYKRMGADWSDTFEDIYNYLPDDPEFLRDMFLNPESYIDETGDLYTVLDNFYYNYDKLFEEDGENHYYNRGNSLTMYHFDEKEFDSLKEAEEFIKSLGNNWKWELQAYIDMDSRYANQDDWGEQDEEEPYTSQGQDINEYITGEEQRFEISKTDAEDIIKHKSKMVKRSAFNKLLANPDWVTKPLAEAMYEEYKGDLKLKFSSKARAILLGFPQFFSEETVALAIKGGVLTESNYAKLYENLPEGDRKDTLRSFLINQAEGRLGFESVKKNYNSQKTSDEESRYGSHHLSGVYFTLRQLLKDGAIPVRVINKTVDTVNQIEQDPDMISVDKNSASRDLIRTLGASNADNRATIELYKKLIPRIRIKILTKHDIQNSLDPEQDYRYSPDFRTIGHALAATGRAGEPLIPLLEEKFAEIDSLTRENITSAYELNDYKLQLKESILYIIDSIRTGQGFSRKYKMM